MKTLFFVDLVHKKHDHKQEKMTSALCFAQLMVWFSKIFLILFNAKSFVF